MMEHLNDGQLIQLLDGGWPRDPQEHNHVDRCHECRARLVTLEARAERFSTLLHQTDENVPTLQLRSRRRFGVRRLGGRVAFAAAIVLALASALFVQPVRAWILAQGRAVWQHVADPGSRTNASAGLESSDKLNTTDVSFIPQRSALRIDVTTRQASGFIVVRIGDGREVTASVSDAGEDDGIVILPNGFRIQNSRRSVATYDVTIPATIETVEVVVAGDTVAGFGTIPSFRERIVNLTDGER